MRYRVTFYCPDTHLTYNLNTLNKQGIGGGVTARIRMAHALGELGHIVTIYNSCSNIQNIDNVDYIPFDRAKRIETDIFIASTSGDGLDLSRLNEIDIHAKLHILMVHGVDPPNGIDLDLFDYVYALSNFMRGIVEDQWEFDPKKIFTSHRGVKEDHYHHREDDHFQRDPLGIIYSSHPSKGLGPAIEILYILNKFEMGFSLHVYGGYSLWGEEEKALDLVPNLTYHGLIGQRVLAHEMEKYSYALNIQDREEPFGISLIEAMRAGCIVLASSVGAFTEIIQSGHNGFLVKGRSSDKSTHHAASRIIMDLAGNEGYRNFISQNAIASPHNWRTIAESWKGHWDWALGGNRISEENYNLGICQSCRSKWLPLADGLHCTGCGRYRLSK